MTLFFLFIFACFFGGMVMWGWKSKYKHVVLFGICLLITFAYFFLDKI